MNLVTFAEHVSVSMEKSAGSSQLVFEAGRDYIIAQAHFNRLIAGESIRQRLFKWSRIENRFPNFNVLAKKPGPSQKLLLYNGSGGYGDQIMTWPFAAILKTYGYDIHILTDPGNTSCWWNFPWIKAVHTFPIQYEQLKMFDYWVMLETVVNAEEHQDQIHPLDQMLIKVGINPDTVDARLKVIRPNFTFLENQTAQAVQGKRFGMYQLSCANPVRSLPPSESAYLISKIAEAYPDIHWFALYDKFIPDTYLKAVQCSKCEGAGKITKPNDNTVMVDAGTKTQEQFAEAIQTAAAPSSEICQKCKGSGTIRPNIQLYNHPILRELWSLTQRASIVIGPDSMMVHVAGSLEIPCVGLWGTCNPANRVKYYKNHFPIWKKEVCAFSPCFAYANVFPRYCPPRKDRNICECLAAISPSDVIDQIKKVIPLPTAK